MQDSSLYHLQKEKERLHGRSPLETIAVNNNPHRVNLNVAVRPRLGRRIMAGFYDLLLLLGVLFIVTLICLFISFQIGGESALSTLRFQWWFKALLIGSIFGFFTLFWTYSGQTLGMVAWRLQLYRDDGYSLTFIDSLIRLLLLIFTFWFGFLWIFKNDNKKALHDILSKTSPVIQSRRIHTEIIGD